MQVAKAVAEGKVKMGMSDLDRLIRLEEFLRGEEKVEARFVFEWTDYDNSGKEVGEEDASPAAADEGD